MEKSSRTAKSLKNGSVAMVFLLFSMILNFFSRKVFLNHLGSEILGLNTTAYNLLEFLNLAELGIGAAVGFSLYKPLANDDKHTINEIINLQGHLYRRIAYIIICGATVLMAFFPLIFHKMDLPLWYAYGSFSALLLNSLLGYFVNYQQIVLTSAQMDYKIQYTTQSWTISKIISQMCCMFFVSNPYLWWLVLEFVFCIISACSLRYITQKNFPFLRKCEKSYAQLKVQYNTIVTKIKQVFFHRIGGFIIFNCSPLIIYAFLSLSEVAYYGNYLIITAGLSRLSNAIFNSMNASIGNLIAEAGKDKILSVFRELFSLRIVLASTMVFGFLLIAQPFIHHWIGSSYLLPISTIFIISINLFISLSRSSVDSFINAYGIFQDTWAPIAEAVLNLGTSILLGFYFGLNGILLGITISQMVIICGWKPIFLFKFGMKLPVILYWKLYFTQIFSCLIIGTASYFILGRFNIDPFTSWFSLIVYGISGCAIYLILLSATLSFLKTGLNDFFKRILHY